MTARGRTPRPLVARRAGVEAGHCRGDAGLVDKDQVLGLDLPDSLAKYRPFLLDVGAVLLAGAPRLFLRHNPNRRRARHSVGRLTRGRPVRAANCSLYSSSVRSFRSLTSARKIASPAASIPSVRPPACGLAQRRPSARACWRHRYTVERPTPKRRETMAGGRPASPASNTRSRRSAE